MRQFVEFAATPIRSERSFIRLHWEWVAFVRCRRSTPSTSRASRARCCSSGGRRRRSRSKKAPELGAVNCCATIRMRNPSSDSEHRRKSRRATRRCDRRARLFFTRVWTTPTRLGVVRPNQNIDRAAATLSPPSSARTHPMIEANLVKMKIAPDVARSATAPAHTQPVHLFETNLWIVFSELSFRTPCHLRDCFSLACPGSSSWGSWSAVERGGKSVAPLSRFTAHEQVEDDRSTALDAALRKARGELHGFEGVQPACPALRRAR